MKSPHRTIKLQSTSAFGIVLSLCLCVVNLILTGCEKTEQNLYPQDRLTLEYSVDRETIHVGDPVELIVTAYAPTNGTLELPEIGRERDIVLLERDWDEIPRNDGLKQSVTRYSITSFRLGTHIVSTGMVMCTVGDQTFSTNFPEVTLSVESSLTEDASSKIADIKPIQKLPGRVPFWLGLVLLSALSAFLIGWIASRLWKNRENIIPSAPPVPPHLIAFRALEALKNRGLLEKDECKPFYIELSMILRYYLEGRFNLNAPDETTEEIIEEMSTSPELNGAQRNILQEFMRQADIVKFAKGHPDRETMESAFKTTKQFVEETQQTGEENE